MSDQIPEISVCIVTYNSREEIEACLQAIAKNQSVSHEILLWDNMPRDGTASYVRTHFPEVRLFGTGENIGYARANNRLFPEAKGRLIYLLNPDTEVEANTMRKIANYFDRNPTVGIASTGLRSSDGVRLEPSVVKYARQSYTRGELGDLPGRLASVIGASMVIRREVIAVTGGFDPAFFLYAEDEDLCLRARQNSWLVEVIPEAIVMHREGASEKETPKEDFWRRKIGAAWQFYRKHYSVRTRWHIARNSVLESRWRLAITRPTAAKAKRTRYRQELTMARRELKSLRSLRRAASQEDQYDPSVRELLTEGFLFEPFVVPGISNCAVAANFGGDLRLQEISLMAPGVLRATLAIEEFHRYVWDRTAGARPIVRFADGEYSFYRLDADGCNGLYQQAESKQSIRQALPSHIKALQSVSLRGKLCPLVYPAISRPVSLFDTKESIHSSSAPRWLRFLKGHGVSLNSENYIPFYAVYAYLCSRVFARAVHGKEIVVLNDDFDERAAYTYFASHGSHPRLHWLPVPSEYAATRWPSTKKSILAALPETADLALVGAGAGALLVCDDVAGTLLIPAIDAGHFLNILNGRADKSGGPRLFTVYETKWD